MKRFFYLAACVSLMILLTAPVVFGQEFDGKWFELKVNFKGYSFGIDSLDKVSGSTTNYMLLQWDGGTEFYSYSIYRPDGTPITQQEAIETVFHPDILLNYETVYDVGMTFERDSTNYINVYHTSLIKIKRDSQGALKSATFTSLGCEVYDGEMNSDFAFGGCTIKGKLISAPPFP
jgi:hypothetical protein